jgi:hypothetical protein
MNQYKSLLLILLFIFCLQSVFAQRLFQSTQEKGVKKFKPSAEFKKKISEISNRPIGTEKGEFSGIFEEDFYQLSNGFISYMPEVEYAHYRLIFDKNEKLIETQTLFHCDVQKEDEYYQILAKMEKAVGKKYFIEDCTSYVKVTNEQGYWYEIEVLFLPKKQKKTALIFDKNLKLIGERKSKLK